MSRELLHVDFFQVRKGEKMTMDVPIVLVGDAPAMKGKGRVMTHGLNLLSIECLPEKIPPQIAVDVSVLKELEDAIHVKDIKLDKDIQIHNNPGQLVAKVSEVIVKVEEEVKPVAAAEGEIPAEGEAAAEGAAPAVEAGADKKAGAKAPEAGKATPAAGKTPATGKAAPAEKKAPEKK
jgi:large subunit ribosomal protein L25